LLKSEKPADSGDNEGEKAQANALLGRFSADLTVVLKDSVEKAVEYIRNEYAK
jgi:hypothetical protein